MAAVDTLEPIGKLTEAERRLVYYARKGRLLWLSPEETIRAEVLRALICGEREDWLVAPEGLRLVGAHIMGNLNFANRTIERLIWLHHAQIPDGIDLRYSQTRAISFSNSRIIGGINASDLRVRGDLFLQDAIVDGKVDLNNAAITGFFAAERVIINNHSDTAIDAQSATFGNLFLNNAQIRGQCDISLAKVAGQFSAVDAAFDNPGKRAVSAQASHIGSVYIDKAKLRGVCDINAAKIDGPFSAVNAIFNNSGDTALSAEESCIGSVLLHDAEIRGVCNIAQSTIVNGFSAIGASFDSSTSIAIEASASKIGRLFLRSEHDDADALKRTKVAGTIVLTLATIEQDIDLEGAICVGGPDGALAARHVHVKGNVYLTNGARVAGALRFFGARIDGRLSLAGSCIASRAASATDPLKGCIDDDPFPFTALDLSEAQVGQLRMPDPTDKKWPDCARPRGIVDLSRARVGTLTDFAAGWPEPVSLDARCCSNRLRDGVGYDADHLVLDGFEYQHLDNPDGNANEPAHVARLRWLRSQSCNDLFTRLKPQPWQHLAKILAAQGYEDEARRIAIERRVSQRYAKDMRPFARFVSWSLHLLADYGFNPWKSVAWSLGVILACATIYANLAEAYCGPASPLCHDGEVFMRTVPADLVPGYDKPESAKGALAEIYPSFDPLAYSFDVFLPFFDVGTERFWRVNTTTGWGIALYWFTVLEQIAGAILVSLTVTGFTGLLTRNTT